MPGYVTVVTPENVKIDYELAGIASRAAAALIDTLWQVLVMAVLGLGWFAIVRGFDIPLMSWVTAVLIVAEFAVYWGYYIYFETASNGQTPGKRALRLRTVREGGLPIDLGCAALRNLIRPIDIIIIGLVSILASRGNQRLGDFAAGTLVVKERTEWVGDLNAEPVSAQRPKAQAGYVKNVELVTPEEFDAAKRFLARRAELREDVREALAAKIAKPLVSRLGIEDGGHIVYSDFLAEIHRRCVEDRGMR